MSSHRALARERSSPDRRPPLTVARKQAGAEGAHPAQRLQRRLGNQGAALVARSALSVSSPRDPAEREATRVAALVMRAAAPAAARAAATSSAIQPRSNEIQR